MTAESRLISLATPCHEVTLSAFLSHAKGGPRFYWESSRDALAYAGAGVAVELSGWGASRFDRIADQARALFDGAVLRQIDSPLARPRLFGGFAFQPDYVPDQIWADFPPAQFVLPHFQLVRSGREAWLTINAQVEPGDDIDRLIPDLAAALDARRVAIETDVAARAEPAALDHVALLTGPDDWWPAVDALTAQMRAGWLDKVVLARAIEARFVGQPDLDHALAYLAGRYPGTYRFLYEPRAGHAFYGATPELLLRVEGQSLHTMALAGSAPRGLTPADDARFGEALLGSAKDRHEHNIVVDALQDALKRWSSRVDTGGTELLKFSNIQHLYTPVQATLKQAYGVLPLLAALHPTPALGGQPRAAALKAIAEVEPVTRGWYAAPIGYLDATLDGAFAVAIRSAVVDPRRAWLYAGCGLVAQSVAQNEWDETALKFKPMLESLGIAMPAEVSQP
jgi:menaquinone-specific isochorismate synthase